MQSFKRSHADSTSLKLNFRSALLGLFIALTIVLASTTVIESGMRSTLTSTSTSTNTLTSTLTQTMTTIVHPSALTVTTTVTYSSFLTTEVVNSATITTTCSLLNQTFTGDQGRFEVNVSYQGSWYAKVNYTYFMPKSTSICVYAGSGPTTITTALGPEGEAVTATAQKLDSSTGNLTIGVCFGNGPGFGTPCRSNSTTLPYGSATTELMAVI